MGQIEETLGNTKWSDGQPEGLRISQWGMGASLGDLSCWIDMELYRTLVGVTALLPSEISQHVFGQLVYAHLSLRWAYCIFTAMGDTIMATKMIRWVPLLMVSTYEAVLILTCLI